MSIQNIARFVSRLRSKDARANSDGSTDARTKSASSAPAMIPPQDKEEVVMDALDTKCIPVKDPILGGFLPPAHTAARSRKDGIFGGKRFDFLKKGGGVKNPIPEVERTPSAESKKEDRFKLVKKARKAVKSAFKSVLAEQFDKLEPTLIPAPVPAEPALDTTSRPTYAPRTALTERINTTTRSKLPILAGVTEPQAIAEAASSPISSPSEGPSAIQPASTGSPADIVKDATLLSANISEAKGFQGVKVVEKKDQANAKVPEVPIAAASIVDAEPAALTLTHLPFGLWRRPSYSTCPRDPAYAVPQLHKPVDSKICVFGSTCTEETVKDAPVDHPIAAVLDQVAGDALTAQSVASSESRRTFTLESLLPSLSASLEMGPPVFFSESLVSPSVFSPQEQERLDREFEMIDSGLAVVDKDLGKIDQETDAIDQELARLESQLAALINSAMPADDNTPLSAPASPCASSCSDNTQSTGTGDSSMFLSSTSTTATTETEVTSLNAPQLDAKKKEETDAFDALLVQDTATKATVPAPFLDTVRYKADTTASTILHRGGETPSAAQARSLIKERMLALESAAAAKLPPSLTTASPSVSSLRERFLTPNNALPAPMSSPARNSVHKWAIPSHLDNKKVADKDVQLELDYIRHKSSLGRGKSILTKASMFEGSPDGKMTIRNKGSDDKENDPKRVSGSKLSLRQLAILSQRRLASGSGTQA